MGPPCCATAGQESMPAASCPVPNPLKPTHSPGLPGAPDCCVISTQLLHTELVTNHHLRVRRPPHGPSPARQTAMQ